MVSSDHVNHSKAVDPMTTLEGSQSKSDFCDFEYLLNARTWDILKFGFVQLALHRDPQPSAEPRLDLRLETLLLPNCLLAVAQRLREIAEHRFFLGARLEDGFLRCVEFGQLLLAMMFEFPRETPRRNAPRQTEGKPKNPWGHLGTMLASRRGYFTIVLGSCRDRNGGSFNIVLILF
jgi:hypothetical protein